MLNWLKKLFSQYKPTGRLGKITMECQTKFFGDIEVTIVIEETENLGETSRVKTLKIYHPASDEILKFVPEFIKHSDVDWIQESPCTK